MSTVSTPETIEPIALAPEDAAAYLSISRRALSMLIADKAITAKKSGARTLVDLASLRAYYASLPAYVSASTPNAPQSLAKRRRATRKVARQ